MARYTVTELFNGNPGPTSFQVWQSLNNGLTFSELDSANRANSGAVNDSSPSGYYKLNSPFILFAIFNGATSFKRCIPFNLKTGKWGDYTPDSPAGPAARIDAWVTWRPNGDYMLVYARVNLMWFAVFSIASQTWTEFAFTPSGGTQLIGSSGIVSLAMDDASGTCTVWFQPKTGGGTATFAVGILADNSLSVKCNGPAINVNSLLNSTIFKGRSFCVAAGGGAQPDVSVLATDSAANPTAVTQHTVNTTFLDGLAVTPVIFPSKDGTTLSALWDVLDGRFMPTPQYHAGTEMASLVLSTSPDGITWTAPSIYWAPAPTDPYEIGSGSGTHGGAGTAQIAPASDLGSGQIGIEVWRFFQDDGSPGNAMYNVFTSAGVHSSQLIESGPLIGSNPPPSPEPFNQEFLASGWPVPFDLGFFPILVLSFKGIKVYPQS